MLTLLLIASLFVSSPATRAVGATEPRYRALVTGKSPLPEGWKLESVSRIDGERAAQVGRKLGGEVASITNSVLRVDGEPVQVNLVDCATPADAAKIRTAIVAVHGGAQVSALLDASTAIEFTKAKIATVIRAHYDLELKPRTVTYRVKCKVAPITSGDYAQWNNLFNSCLALDRAPTDAAAAAKLANESRAFTFGGPLRLRARGLGDALSTFDFVPAGRGVELDAGSGSIARSFDELPKQHGVPSVSMTAIVTSTAFALTPSTRKADPALLAPTAFWPSDDPTINELARGIVADAKDTRARAGAILAWIANTSNIRYGGEMLGSRWGVKQVLEQRFGRCWDFSDCFVTLCRAAGVPARQVGGWLYPQGGHVWAEVLLEGEGWRQVDPTAGSACWSEHVPYVVSEDGNWPFVYTSGVEIEVLDPDAKR